MPWDRGRPRPHPSETSAVGPELARGRFIRPTVQATTKVGPYPEKI